jgi:flagellin-specific chaperone FliS
MSKLNEYKKSEISQKKELADPREIIYELLSHLNKSLSDAIKNIDKGKIDDAKEKARKAEAIAHALQNCLNVKDGGEIAENLNYLYRHIRFAAKNLLEKEKSELLTSAHFVSNEILEGWKGLNSSVA